MAKVVKKQVVVEHVVPSLIWPEVKDCTEHFKKVSLDIIWNSFNGTGYHDVALLVLKKDPQLFESAGRHISLGSVQQFFVDEPQGFKYVKEEEGFIPLLCLLQNSVVLPVEILDEGGIRLLVYVFKDGFVYVLHKFFLGL